MNADASIAPAEDGPVAHDHDIYLPYLNADLECVIELGCGNGAHATRIATTFPQCAVTAFEVDRIQHAKNLSADKPDNLTFDYAGAENIPLADATVDRVMMFKSLHHVPVDQMLHALGEVARVLKPGALAYVNEPVFAGDFNEIIRLFHDEQAVREAAYNAICRSVEDGLFTRHEQIFYRSPTHFDSFDAFEQRLLQATHTDHQLSQSTYDEVREKFCAHLGSDGAQFQSPMRVDVLQKPA